MQWRSLDGMDAGKLASKDKRNDCHQLHEDVQSRSRGILQRVTNSVTHHCCLVGLRALTNGIAIVIVQGPRLDVLLGIVPSSTSIGS